MSLVVDARRPWPGSMPTRPGRRFARCSTAWPKGAIVPSLWRLEVANGLTVAVRRQHIDAEFRRAALADLALWDIAVDQHTDARAWGDTFASPTNSG